MNQIEFLNNGLLFYDDKHNLKITFSLCKESKVLKTQTSLYVKKFNEEDDIELKINNNKVKENIIIYNQKENYEYTYNIELTNLILKEENKQYFFLDKTNKEKYLN